MKRLLQLAVIAALCPSVALPAFAATSYIRPDGWGRWTAARVSAGFTGAAIGCNGTTDAAYSGSGVNQNCAYNDVRFLWDDQTFGNYPKCTPHEDYCSARLNTLSIGIQY
jgi:hypothetical protein